MVTTVTTAMVTTVMVTTVMVTTVTVMVTTVEHPLTVVNLKMDYHLTVEINSLAVTNKATEPPLDLVN
jgi:hypothetical protein